MTKISVIQKCVDFLGPFFLQSEPNSTDGKLLQNALTFGGTLVLAQCTLYLPMSGLSVQVVVSRRLAWPGLDQWPAYLFSNLFKVWKTGNEWKSGMKWYRSFLAWKLDVGIGPRVLSHSSPATRLRTCPSTTFSTIDYIIMVNYCLLKIYKVFLKTSARFVHSSN